MKIVISNQSSKAIYEQIIEQIKTQIINGDVDSSEPLPSIRSLAKELTISVITTKRAYEELEKEGLIYSVPGKGFFVGTYNVDVLREKKIAMIEDNISRLIDECKTAGLSKQDVLDMVDALYE